MSGKNINLAPKLEEKLPPELVAFMKLAGRVSLSQKQNLFLVGGVVRDLLLEKANLDLDLVVEGDAVRLAQELVRRQDGKLTTHPQFNTAKIEWDGWSADIATARTETYAHPGALPHVQFASIGEDLFRRDFTVNAMAVYLNPERYGELIDLYGGVDDLKHKTIRILHAQSFIDDATRIWRAIRYEQRLDFSIEPATLELLKRDIPLLDTISGDRIRNELELVLKEEFPEKALRRAGELGVLAKVSPSLKTDEWLSKMFSVARKYFAPYSSPPGLYWALMIYRLTANEINSLISYLRIPKVVTQVIRDTASIRGTEKHLAEPGLAPSRIYHLLHGHAPLAMMAVSIARDSAVIQEHTRLYLGKLRYVRTSLNGNDLLRMGIPAGPRIKEVLQQLLDARLDGKVTGRKGEEEMVKRWL